MVEQGIEYWDTHIQEDSNNLSHWVKLYERIFKIFPTDKNIAMVDFGCQGGYFAKFIYGKGYRNYWGIDFAPSTIEMAKKVVPEFNFTIGSVYDKKIQDEFPKYDVFIGIEFFQLIKKDLEVISAIPPGKFIILSVPNQNSIETVRCFKTSKEVIKRYKHLIEFEDIKKLPCYRHKIFYLAYGIKI